MIIQGSDEWKALRVGKVTASRVADVIAKTKTGWGASRANYAAELIAERLTGEPAAHYISKEMQHGTETEPQARAAYEFHANVDVAQVAFVDHPAIAMSGASPDGLVGEAGLIEIKCPGTATHIATLLGKPIAAEYVTQMQWQMACTGRQWCDFVSFDPRMPAAMQLLVRRVARDQAFIEATEREVVAFLADVEGKVAQLTAIYERQEAA